MYCTEKTLFFIFIGHGNRKVSDSIIQNTVQLTKDWTTKALTKGEGVTMVFLHHWWQSSCHSFQGGNFSEKWPIFLSKLMMWDGVTQRQKERQDLIQWSDMLKNSLQFVALLLYLLLFSLMVMFWVLMYIARGDNPYILLYRRLITLVLILTIWNIEYFMSLAASFNVHCFLNLLHYLPL